MKRILAATAALGALGACGDGNPIFTEPGGLDGPGNATLIEEDTSLTANNVTFDATNDTLIINNIPFDDPNNQYDRIAGDQFTNGFDAYSSNPAAGSNEDQYFAIFRRSDSGQSQVTGVATAEFIGFGFGGGVAQRLGGTPTLPQQGVFTYNGEYGGVRTVLNAQGNGQEVQYITGDAELRADFGDFDNVGAVGGLVVNRTLYDSSGAIIGALGSNISLANGDIDFATGQITTSTTVLLATDGSNVGTGEWEGVLAGPGGNEIAGVLVVEGTDVIDPAAPGAVQSVREVGGFIANQ